VKRHYRIPLFAVVKLDAAEDPDLAAQSLAGALMMARGVPVVSAAFEQPERMTDDEIVAEYSQ
jgi:hypothetical protein